MKTNALTVCARAGIAWHRNCYGACDSPCSACRPVPAPLLVARTGCHAFNDCRRNKMKLRMVLFGALSVATASAHAGDWYGLGLVTGSSASLDKSTTDQALTAAGAAGLSSSTNDSTTKWRLQLGYKFNDYLAVEGGYIDLGKSEYSASYAGGKASGSVEAAGPNLDALLMLPLGEDLSLFGELGVVDAKVKSKLSASGAGAAAADKYDNTKARPLYGLGAIYSFSDHTAMRASYERVTSLGDSNRIGSMDVDMYSVGLSYTF
jgi:OOP family OmpA-OmpF porin